MEELDLLKKDWNKDGNRYPKVSENDIYAMLHRKSSSIIKWILLISILEFAFFLGLTLLLSDYPGVKHVENALANYLNVGITVIDMAINLTFMYLFYTNYKKITTVDNVKNLMSNILRTRKTVSTYIFVKIAYLIVSSGISLCYLLNNDPELLSLMHSAEEKGHTFLAYAAYIGGAIILVAIFAFLLWLFYRLIYGFLLKRLKQNYEELKKIEV